MSEQNKAVVLELFHLFDQGRFDEGRALLHKDFTEQGTTATIAEFIDRRRAFYASFPDGRHLFEDVVAEGDLVATTGSLAGTHRGAFMGIPATGKRVSMRVWHLHRVKDGKIIEHRAVAEMLALLRQLGVEIPPSGPAR